MRQITGRGHSVISTASTLAYGFVANPITGAAVSLARASHGVTSGRVANPISGRAENHCPTQQSRSIGYASKGAIERAEEIQLIGFLT
jgi:hypothetical protein